MLGVVGTSDSVAGAPTPGTPTPGAAEVGPGQSGEWLASVVGDIPTVPRLPAVRRTSPPSGRRNWRDAHWEQMGNGGYLHALSRPLAEEELADEATRHLAATAPAARRARERRDAVLEGGPLGAGFWARLQEWTGLGMLRPRVRGELPYRLAVRMWRRLVIFVLVIGALLLLAQVSGVFARLGKL